MGDIMGEDISTGREGNFSWDDNTHYLGVSPAGGMFLWGILAEQMDAAEGLKIALQRKVAFVPGEAFHATGGRAAHALTGMPREGRGRGDKNELPGWGSSSRRAKGIPGAVFHNWGYDPQLCGRTG
jgi:hypothetical protein